MNDDEYLEGDDIPREQADGQRDAAAERAADVARARPFLATQYMVAVGSLDADGAPWTSLMFGKPGFVRTLDGAAIQLGIPIKERDLADPVWDNMAVDAELGLQFIDLAADRRYRVGAAVQRLDRRGAELSVREACPDHPGQPGHGARRALRQLGEPRLPVQTAHGTLLRGAVERIVRRADTLFLTRHHAGRGVGTHHHGGEPGFVTLTGPGMLRVPDHADAAGETACDPRAGICIPDFDHGQVLQLTGQVRSRIDAGGRHWEFAVARWILRDMPRAMAWDVVDVALLDPA